MKGMKRCNYEIVKPYCRHWCFAIVKLFIFSRELKCSKSVMTYRVVHRCFRFCRVTIALYKSMYWNHISLSLDNIWGSCFSYSTYYCIDMWCYSGTLRLTSLSISITRKICTRSKFFSTVITSLLQLAILVGAFVNSFYYISSYDDCIDNICCIIHYSDDGCFDFQLAKYDFTFVVFLLQLYDLRFCITTKCCVANKCGAS